MENTLISYKGSLKLKKDFVREVGKHRKADMLVQGTYGKENGHWKGCAVACSLRSLAIMNKEELVTEYNQHAQYESKLGLPEWLARLEDTIFEGLPKEDAMKWPEQFAKAIPVGVNLEPVKWKFTTFILKENIERVLTLKIEDSLREQVIKAIQGVLKLNENAIKTGTWNESAAESAAWSAARSAAWSAARSAARSAAESAAWSAAESAAWSAAWSAAESAAWSAAWSAAESAAWSAAESAAYQTYSKELLRLLKAAK